MLIHRPCGACVALVSAADGCEHWRPKTSATMRTIEAERSRARRAKRQADVEAARAQRQTLTPR